MTRETILHASCVALGGRAVLIMGASGSGKSGLALALMGLGCGLVADDRVVIRGGGEAPVADAPGPIRGVIEARGIGLLNAGPAGPARVVLAVDLDRTETARMPQARNFDLAGHPIPLLLRVDGPHFPYAVLQYLKAGRWEDT